MSAPIQPATDANGTDSIHTDSTGSKRADFQPLMFALGTLLFLNVYAPQSLLPQLAREFGVGSAAAGVVVGSTILAMALFAPLAGLIADALGRRRVMIAAFALLLVPCMLAALSHSLWLLSGARFLQGMCIPLVTVASSAYLAEECPPAGFGRALSAYVTGTIVGGFGGRLLSGLVAEHAPWQWAFWLLCLSNLLGIVVARQLPAEHSFQPQRNLAQAAATTRTHLQDRILQATFAVGFLVLFVLVAIFNTVTFRLAQPPYTLSSTVIGGIFAVYLLGAVVTPLTAPWLERTGPRFTLPIAVLVNVAGLALTLARPLALVVFGLAVAACGVFISQAAALSAVQKSVRSGRSVANGLYNLAYYSGGSVASILAGAAYDWQGWRAVCALCAAAMLLAGGLGYRYWTETPSGKRGPGR